MIAQNREPEPYPAIHHIGIVVERGFTGRPALLAVLDDFEVTEPLHHGQKSRTGAYSTLRVSVRVESRDALERLDAALRAVDGVKLLL